MKILLLGANGQLGQTFLDHGGLAARGELVAASRNGELIHGGIAVTGDLGDLAGLEALLEAERPDIIINAAAYTAVDKAEDNEAAAFLINGEVPGVIGRWAMRHGALAIHYSTDYVFPGNADVPYLPASLTGPQGAYGRSKLAGEIALRDSCAAHMIFRTAWVYSPVGHNFLRTMLGVGANRGELRVVADQRGTPTTAALIVDGTLAAMDRYIDAGDASAQFTGTFHLTATGETTWHGFAEAIFDEAMTTGLLSRRPLVHAITSADFPTPAKRPAYSVLDTTSFSRIFDHTLQDWREGVHETIRALSTASPPC